MRFTGGPKIPPLNLSFQSLAPGNQLQDLRDRYRDEVGVSQELYLEHRVQGGQAYLGFRDGVLLGYGILHQGAWVEVHVPGVAPQVRAGFLEALAGQGWGRDFLVPYFDRPLVQAAELLGLKGNTAGFLHRNYDAKAGKPGPQLVPQALTPADAAKIWPWSQDFFETRVELEGYLAQGALRGFKLPGEEALRACGLVQRIQVSRPHFDLGMVVDPHLRGHGIGSQVVRLLAQELLSQGRIPSAGCDAENQASRGALRRAGFQREYELRCYTALE